MKLAFPIIAAMVVVFGNGARAGVSLRHAGC